MPYYRTDLLLHNWGFTLSLYEGMGNYLLEALFGCSHRKTTFPRTPPPHRNVCARISEPKTQTYVACLDCAKELPYDWEKMQVIKTSSLAGPVWFRRLAITFRPNSPA